MPRKSNNAKANSTKTHSHCLHYSVVKIPTCFVLCFLLLDFCSIQNSIPEACLPKPVMIFYEPGINLKTLMFQILFIFEMKEGLALFVNGLYT